MPKFDEISVQLEKGPHVAKAVFRKYDRWVIHAIERSGLPPLRDDDHSFADVAEAKAAAHKLWISTLP